MTTATIVDFDQLIRARAAGARAAYDGRHMRLRATGVVHEVASLEWLSGAEIPAPRCGAATVGGPLADGVPTVEPVNCLRCLRGNPEYRSARVPRGVIPGQPPLPGLD